MSFILLTNSNFVISFNLNILEASSLRLSVKEPEIANFDLENVGEDSFSKFRQFKLWSVENDVFEDTNVIKHLTKLAQASEEYTAKLELNTAI
jgi:uncharacterized radical SAM superfamily protein